MLFINTLKISDDRTTIDIDVETSELARITSIKLWTDETYKEDFLFSDLSNKIDGTDNREVLFITPEDIGETNFNGIYFLEFITNDTTDLECVACNETSLIGVTADFTKYHECIVDSVIKHNDIQKAKQINLVFDAVYSALKIGYYEEAIYIFEQLQSLCTTDCVSCTDKVISTNSVNTTFGTFNNILI